MGLIRKASLLVEQGSADVWVGHRKMHNVDFPHEVPRRWVHRIKSIPGVTRAVEFPLEGDDLLVLTRAQVTSLSRLGLSPEVSHG